MLGTLGVLSAATTTATAHGQCSILYIRHSITFYDSGHDYKKRVTRGPMSMGPTSLCVYVCEYKCVVCVCNSVCTTARGFYFFISSISYSSGCCCCCCWPFVIMISSVVLLRNNHSSSWSAVVELHYHYKECMVFFVWGVCVCVCVAVVVGVDVSLLLLSTLFANFLNVLFLFAIALPLLLLPLLLLPFHYRHLFGLCAEPLR